MNNELLLRQNVVLHRLIVKFKNKIRKIKNNQMSENLI